jgi:hypothetical protein
MSSTGVEYIESLSWGSLLYPQPFADAVVSTKSIIIATLEHVMQRLIRMR